MQARPYGRLIDHFLQRSGRIMHDTQTHAGCYAVQWRAFFPWEAHVVCGGILTYYIHSTPIMMQTSISRVEDIRLSRYLTTTRSFHLHRDLLTTLGVLRLNLPMLIHYRLLAGRGPVLRTAETSPSVQATLHIMAMVGCL